MSKELKSSGTDRRIPTQHCAAHVAQVEKQGTLAGEVRTLMWGLGGSAVLMMTVLTGVIGFIAYTYQHGEILAQEFNAQCAKAKVQISTSNTGISRNRRDIQLINGTLTDHELRLRAGERSKTR